MLKTNLQAADEIARQLKLRNIGGMVIVDFIDMTSRMDKLAVLEHFELALEKDKAKPQIGQLSDLGLVELTRHRQGQSLAEIFTHKCDKCNGQGFVVEDLKFQTSTAQGEARAKINKIKGPFSQGFTNEAKPNNNQKFNKKDRRDKFNKNPKNREENQISDEIKELNQDELISQIDEIIAIPEVIEVAQPPEENEQKPVEVVPQEQQEVDVQTPEQTVEEKPKKVPRKAKKTQKKEAAKKAEQENEVIT